MTYHYPTKPLFLKNLDLDKELGIVTDGNLSPNPSSSAHKPRPYRLFIKGPIPFDWLQKANAIGGSTGIVAVALWFYVGLHGSKRFKIDSRLDSLCCLTRQTRDHILKRLEYRGLIKLFTRRGSYPTVEILDPPTM